MKLTTILTGYFKLDGGAMFGIVPKRIWQKMNPPDVDNMCTWAMRALLVETAERRILIDTGIGNKQDEKFRAHFLPEQTGLLFTSLEQAGYAPNDITDVFLTHLHFDHCGGALWKDETTGEIAPTFPNAIYWTNEPHYRWATTPNAREKASFLAENFQLLYDLGQLRFVEVQPNAELYPGFGIRFAYGHTEAMMLPVLDTGQRIVVYCADLIPSQWHIGLPYIMAYDVRPLITLEEKAQLLGEAVQKEYVLFFEHDPGAEAAVVAIQPDGRIAASKTGPLNAFL
ncbi:MAG: MBL fold metallo-hydrolase [Saprospiraceae bacterium]|nr:MBL fold metallo-hydrolase [Saprospiraceae bacterium]MDW8484925.1 MBL fold metallo-hydrolase [Saprospiraceae bacterium]